MTSMMTTTTPQRWAYRWSYPVKFDEGEYPEQACAICATRPCSIRISRWDAADEVMEALQKTGFAGPLEQRYYCAEHQTVASDVYRQMVEETEQALAHAA